MDQSEIEADISVLWAKVQGWVDGFVALLPNLVAAALLLLLVSL